MRLRLFMATLSVLLGTACHGTSSSHTFWDTQSDYRLSEHPDKGLVIVSTRFSTDCKEGETPSAALAYQDVHAMQSGTNVFPVNDPRIPYDFQAPPGHFSVKTLYAGSNRIRSVNIGSNIKETRTPFEVEAGKAIYLGEVHIKITQCGPEQSITTHVTDQWERDSKLFQYKLKNVRPEEVVKRLLGARPAKP